MNYLPFLLSAIQKMLIFNSVNIYFYASRPSVNGKRMYDDSVETCCYAKSSKNKASVCKIRKGRGFACASCIPRHRGDAGCTVRGQTKADNAR